MRRGTKLLFGNIWKYVLVAAAVILMWSAVFESLRIIKDDERLAITIYNIDCDIEALREDILQQLPSLTEQELQAVYVETYDHYHQQTYADNILTAQIAQTDLVIIPEHLLDQIEVPFHFPALPESLITENTYQVDGVSYGILISGEGMKNRFTQYCQTDVTCYLLISSTTVNLGGVNGRGEVSDDVALQVLRYLMEVRDS
jgi:hypothetical protein